MLKEKNDLVVFIIFSIIWIVRPISYEEMRNRHPIDSQISCIPTQREEALSIRGGWVSKNSENECPKRGVAPSYRHTPVFSKRKLPNLPEFSEFGDDSDSTILD